MKWIILLVALLMLGLFIESKWEKKKKEDAKSVDSANDVYSPGELIGEMKAKQDGK
ncbi:MAG: hypothetical protein IJA84_04530 [Clostridia bacterium]|nr:hypothetical protein [Clostridia bacterium]